MPTLREVAALRQRCAAADRRDRSQTIAAESQALARAAASSASPIVSAARSRRIQASCRSSPRSAASWPTWISTFCIDQSRDLFAIGYNVSDQRLDSSFYDLLASEARLASYVVIAQGRFGQEHWFALGRLLTTPAACRRC